MFDPVNHGQIDGDGLIINTNGYYIAGNAFSGALNLTPTGTYLRLGGTGAVLGNTFRTNYTGIIAEGIAEISGNSLFAHLPLQILASQTVVPGNGNSYYGLNSPVMAVDIAPNYSGGIASVDLGPDYIDQTFSVSYNVNLPGASSQLQYVNGKIRGLGEDGSTNGLTLNALVSLERLDPVTKTVATSLTLKHRDSGSIIDNAGATGPTTITLPLPVHRLRYTFQIRAAQAMTIQTDAGDHYILALNSAQTSLGHSAAHELYAEVTLEGLYDLNAGQVYLANRQYTGHVDVVGLSESYNGHAFARSYALKAECCLRPCKVLGHDRTKMFHVKHF
jgi:hypothetical protein